MLSIQQGEASTPSGAAARGESPELGKVVFYLPEGEFHEIGLLYYHYVARSAGFNTLYLGFSLPYNDLLEVNRSVQAYGYFTSFVTSLSDCDLQSMLERLQKDFPGKRFFLSGRVMRERMPKLPANFNLICRLSGYFYKPVY